MFFCLKKLDICLTRLKKCVVMNAIRSKKCIECWFIRWKKCNFHKDSGLELDFLVRFKGECVLLEIKAKSGKAKSITTVLKNKDVYHVKNAIKLGQYNVSRDGDILTIPLYMGFLVNDKLADVIIPDVDVSALNNEE